MVKDTIRYQHKSVDLGIKKLEPQTFATLCFPFDCRHVPDFYSQTAVVLGPPQLTRACPGSRQRQTSQLLAKHEALVKDRQATTCHAFFFKGVIHFLRGSTFVSEGINHDQPVSSQPLSRAVLGQCGRPWSGADQRRAEGEARGGEPATDPNCND